MKEPDLSRCLLTTETFLIGTYDNVNGGTVQLKGINCLKHRLIIRRYSGIKFVILDLVGNPKISSVYMENGSVSYDPDIILAKWKSDFETLFNPNINISDDSFLNRVDGLTREWEAEF